MNSEEKLTEVAEEIEDTELKEKEPNLVDKIKSSDTGKAIFGEDGRFDKEDVERLTRKAKETKLGKKILGEDGKLDREDFKRLAGDTDDVIKEVLGKVKNIFRQ